MPQTCLKSYSTDFPQLGLCTSSGHVANEACCTIRWHVEINDTDYPLDDTKNMANIDLATILISPHADLVSSYNNSPIKWKCSNPFLFTLLTTLCQWCVQDSIFRSPKHPMHITTTCIIRKFPRYKEWQKGKGPKYQIWQRFN